MNKWKIMTGVAVLAAGSVQASLVAYEGFDYAGGVNFNVAPASNGGTGWTSAWSSTGVSGLTVSGSGKSLYFGQTPDLIVDGSSHIWSESSKGNYRNFTDVSMGSETLYFTALVRAYGGGAATADLRVQLHDGLGASGNIRGNFGVTDGTLFADGDQTPGGYGSGDTLASAFADDTTYLLVAKRNGASISAALITADGNAATLAAEPTWQVIDTLATGVTFKSIRFLTNGSGGGAGIRVDEIRIATDWNSAVAGMVIPEPATFGLFAAVGGGILFFRRRFMI